MNAASLAQAAQCWASPFCDTLAPSMLRQLEQAYIARWLSAQDNPALALDTFEGALALIRGMKIKYIKDPGHGWLAVPLSLIAEWSIAPSPYSYRDDSTGYLEEDCDAALFMDAATALGVLVELTIEHSNADSFVRNLPRFTRSA